MNNMYNFKAMYRITVIALVFTVMLITSCATIFNLPHKNVTIYTTEPSTIIYKQDTVNTIDNKVHLRVERKNEPLSIIAATDSLSKSIEIKQINSAMYWANLYPFYGIGMLVDKNNPKRYSYPEKIYINSANAVSGYSRFGEANNKRELYLHLSLPQSFNIFLMSPEDESVKTSTGFTGITVGFDYYHSKSQFIHLRGSAISGGSKPDPRFVTDKYKNLLSSKYISLSNNHKIRQFSIGYGLSYTKNCWIFYKRGFQIPPFIKKQIHKESYNAFGFIIPTYYQPGNYFNIGVVYRPTFYRPNMTDKFAYEHIISVDFAWKIRIKK